MMDLINPLFGWWGIGGAALAACAVLAYLFPPFRKLAILAGGVIVALLAAYTKGSRDATRRKQAQWDRAIVRDVEKGRDARADAERAVDADPDGMQRDQWNRDTRGL